MNFQLSPPCLAKCYPDQLNTSLYPAETFGFDQHLKARGVFDSLESKNTEQLTTPTLLFIIHYNYIRFAFLFFNIRFSAHGEPQCFPELPYDLAPLNFLRDPSANSQRS